MRVALAIIGFCLAVPVAAGLLMRLETPSGEATTLLNVSYDPTRELWSEINRRFAADWQQRTGRALRIRQSHGGSASQARTLIDGLPADVVSLALWTDTDVLREYDLLADGWDRRLPNGSSPYYSTIVFVVRKGNPKNILDWNDLIRPGIEVVTPNPKTSGNGKLAFLAAWGSIRRRGGSDADAKNYVTTLYGHVPILDTGARGATMTFAQNGRGDVHLTWENEARLELREWADELEIIYPAESIRAEPPVAVVDKVVDARRSRELAETYLKSLYLPEYQEIIARNYFRPIDAVVFERHRAEFPELQLFSITAAAPSWAAAQQKFFGPGGIFDTIYAGKNDGR